MKARIGNDGADVKDEAKWKLNSIDSRKLKGSAKFGKKFKLFTRSGS